MARTLLVSLLPWVAAAAGLGIVGGVLGVTGTLGRPALDTTSVAGGVLGSSVDAAACPGGAVIGSIAMGSRVLAVARSDDSSALGVRDPRDSGRVVWLPSVAVVLDRNQPAVSSLPVSGCPTLETVSTSAPAESTAPSAPPPATVTDATAPTITSATATPGSIYQHGFSPEKSVIAASASDNVAVTGIDASWPAVGPIAAGTAHIAGSSGSFVFGPFSIAPTDAGTFAVPVTLVAHDAAGNSSPARVVTVTVEFNYG